MHRRSLARLSISLKTRLSSGPGEIPFFGSTEPATEPCTPGRLMCILFWTPLSHIRSVDSAEARRWWGLLHTQKARMDGATTRLSSTLSSSAGRDSHIMKVLVTSIAGGYLTVIKSADE